MQNKQIRIKNNRGQITVFVIIGIVIVVGILLLFLFSGRLNPPPSVDDIVSAEEQPQESIEQCIGLAVEEASDLLIENGGYITKSYLNVTFIYPKGYYKQGIFEDVPYYCYTQRYRTRCIPQEPVLMEHLKDELEMYLEDKIEDCFDDFERELKRKAYSVNIGEKESQELILLPGKINIDIEREVVISKSGESKKFTDFSSTTNTRLYDMAEVIQEIVSEEARYCNSDYIQIMRYNTWAKITKYVTQSNIEIYTIKDMASEKEFMFAVRGCVLPIPN